MGYEPWTALSTMSAVFRAVASCRCCENRRFVSGDNVFPARYELGFYIPEDGILHSHRRENLKSYIALTG
jgi:hypothetical protein